MSTVRASFHISARVAYATSRSENIQCAFVDATIDADLPVVDPAELTPLVRWRRRQEGYDLHRVYEERVYVRLSRESLAPLPDALPMHKLPRGARPVADGRAEALATLRTMADGAISSGGHVFIRSSGPCARLHPGGGVDYLQTYPFDGDHRGFSGFETNRFAHYYRKDHHWAQLPLNLHDPEHLGRLFGAIRRNVPGPDFLDYELTRPDLVPRRSEPRAAAVSACLMAAAAVRQASTTSDASSLEYALEMVRHADRAMLDIAEFDVIHAMLDELPGRIAAVFGYDTTEIWKRDFIRACRHVMVHGDPRDEGSRQEIVDQFAGTQAHREWKLLKSIGDDPSLVEI